MQLLHERLICYEVANTNDDDTQSHWYCNNSTISLCNCHRKPRSKFDRPIVVVAVTNWTLRGMFFRACNLLHDEQLVTYRKSWLFGANIAIAYLQWTNNNQRNNNWICNQAAIFILNFKRTKQWYQKANSSQRWSLVEIMILIYPYWSAIGFCSNKSVS